MINESRNIRNVEPVGGVARQVALNENRRLLAHTFSTETFSRFCRNLLSLTGYGEHWDAQGEEVTNSLGRVSIPRTDNLKISVSVPGRVLTEGMLPQIDIQVNDYLQELLATSSPRTFWADSLITGLEIGLSRYNGTINPDAFVYCDPYRGNFERDLSFESSVTGKRTYLNFKPGDDIQVGEQSLFIYRPAMEEQPKLFCARALEIVEAATQAHA